MCCAPCPAGSCFRPSPAAGKRTQLCSSTRCAAAGWLPAPQCIGQLAVVWSSWCPGLCFSLSKAAAEALQCHVKRLDHCSPPCINQPIYHYLLIPFAGRRAEGPESRVRGAAVAPQATGPQRHRGAAVAGLADHERGQHPQGARHQRQRALGAAGPPRARGGRPAAGGCSGCCAGAAFAPLFCCWSYAYDEAWLPLAIAEHIAPLLRVCLVCQHPPGHATTVLTKA